MRSWKCHRLAQPQHSLSSRSDAHSKDVSASVCKAGIHPSIMHPNQSPCDALNKPQVAFKHVVLVFCNLRACQERFQFPDFLE